MCSASFCHWAGSRAMLLIFTLRRLFILGDGSLFSLLSLTPRDEAASKSGLWGGDGPSATQRHQRFRLNSSRNKIHNFFVLFSIKNDYSLCYTVHFYSSQIYYTMSQIYCQNKFMLAALILFLFTCVYRTWVWPGYSGSRAPLGSLFQHLTQLLFMDRSCSLVPGDLCQRPISLCSLLSSDGCPSPSLVQIEVSSC